MIFNSVTFLLFLAIVLALYWLLPRRPRIWLLFLSGLVFYGFWRVEYLVILLASAVTDYLAALAIAGSASAGRRRLFLGLSLAVNFGLLFYFKYLMFFASNGVGLLRFLGFDVAEPSFSIILPLGISFYTFQTVSYTVDVYRGFIRPERNFPLYGAYVVYFPQLVAGPILRARELLYQLGDRRRLQFEDVAIGLRRLVSGLFLKVVLADNLAPLVDAGFQLRVDTLTALDVWTLAFLFGFQIYFDFSAYSHIALGCARLMAIRLPENFEFPYLASSPREFWRRWHISLSSWIRDYLYLPLMGARVRDESVGGLATASDQPTESRRTAALFATWAIMGLWHGANWTFVLWGVYHALLVYGHRRLSGLGARLPEPARSVLGWAIMLPLVMLSWIPFRAESLPAALAMWGKLLLPTEYLALGMRETTYLVAALLLLAVVWAWLAREYVIPALRRTPFAWPVVQTAGYTVAIALVFVFLRPITQFIYFQF
jgi:D-alanyl-lipoteichoic acid acyltransferase DltB (MBOAT superfamily)